MYQKYIHKTQIKDIFYKKKKKIIFLQKISTSYKSNRETFIMAVKEFVIISQYYVFN